MTTDQRSGGANSSYFTVDKLPMHERYGVWRDSIDILFGVEAEKSIRDNNFTATIESHLLGSLMMMDVASLQQDWGRSKAQIAHHGMDHFGVGIFKEGDLICDDAKGGTQLKKGGLVVFDLTQHFNAKTSDIATTTIVLPRPLIEDLVDQPDDHSMRFLEPNDPMTRILYDQILSIQRNISALNQHQAQAIEKSCSMLLANCLNTATGATRDTTQQRQNITDMVRIRRYIREQLASSDLSPRKAARDLGVSRSKLYACFAAYGGVYAYIRDMRLRRAISLLSDPMRRHLPIFDTALQCGFSSDASFIRAFREKYDLTPGDVRNGVSILQATTTAQNDEVDTRYQKWLHELIV